MHVFFEFLMSKVYEIYLEIGDLSMEKKYKSRSTNEGRTAFA
jgi:hypothetical protein